MSIVILSLFLGRRIEFVRVKRMTARTIEYLFSLGNLIHEIDGEMEILY